ncbi:hypothetical protein MCHIJ_26500 [Mycolicibacterium chitae]|nr:hypothetical protein MCHIJ_26500 [Mycolicibacterium chitae]
MSEAARDGPTPTGVGAAAGAVARRWASRAPAVLRAVGTLTRAATPRARGGPRTSGPTCGLARDRRCAGLGADPAGGAAGWRWLPQRPALVFINSPSNPTGKVLGVDHLRKVVTWARERGAIVASDECYLGLGWDAAPVSVLHPDVCDGDHTGLLAIHSLSKTSSLAGYRAGFVAGEVELIAELLAVRKHAGMMMPGPIQAAMVAALNDDAHEVAQRETYARRREVLLPAVRAAGFTVEHSEAGLYLWATRGEPCRDTVAWLAERGILAAPGEFYGPRGAQHVRIALTATDERVAAAAARLA